jgi:hypothetical protein
VRDADLLVFEVDVGHGLLGPEVDGKCFWMLGENIVITVDKKVRFHNREELFFCQHEVTARINKHRCDQCLKDISENLEPVLLELVKLYFIVFHLFHESFILLGLKESLHILACKVIIEDFRSRLQ